MSRVFWEMSVNIFRSANKTNHNSISSLCISQSCFDIDRLVHGRDIGGVDCVRAWAELGCSCLDRASSGSAGSRAVASGGE